MQNLTVDDIKDVVAGALSNVLSHSSNSSTFRSTVREEPSPRPVPSVSSGGVDNRSRPRSYAGGGQQLSHTVDPH